MSETENASRALQAPEAPELVVSEGGRALAVLDRFVETKAYQIFVDVCEFSRQSRTVGICSGATGVGKTLAARRYSQWDVIEPRLSRHAASQNCVSAPHVVPRTAFYTPRVTATPKGIELDVTLLRWEIQRMADVAAGLGEDEGRLSSGFLHPGQVHVLIVDEANRLCPLGLEVLRDVFDRENMGMVLVGRPGLERNVLRNAPLASRVGMRSAFEGLQEQELRPLLQQALQGSEVEIDAQVLEAIIERTKGNFRTVRLVVLQIEYILRINKRFKVTTRIVDIACSQLLR